MRRIAGALFRAAAVLLVIAAPALLLPGVSRTSLEVSLMLAGLAALFTLVEYAAAAPSLIDFRFAPPYNRGRFLTLAAILLTLVFVARATEGAPDYGPELLAFADRVAASLDFPLSPTHLAVDVLAAGREPGFALLVGRTAALALAIAAAGLVFFVALLWVARWPQGREKFNLWVNLPTFTPSTGRDVERRLIFGGWANIAVGLTLPLTIVVLSSRAIGWIDPQAITSYQTLVWLVALWAFLPMSLVVRGAALIKVGWLVRRARRV